MPLSDIPIPLLQHILVFVAGEEALAHCIRACDGHNCAGEKRGLSHLRAADVKRRGQIRRVSKEWCAVAGSLVSVLEVPLSGLLPRSCGCSPPVPAAVCLSRLRGLVIRVRRPELEQLASSTGREQVTSSLIAMLSPALVSRPDELLIRVEAVSKDVEWHGAAGEAGGQQFHRGLLGLWEVLASLTGPAAAAAAQSSSPEHAWVGTARLREVDLRGLARSVEDRDVHSLLQRARDLESLGLTRCNLLKRPLSPLLQAEYAPELLRVSLDGAWRLAVDELFEVRASRPGLHVDLVDDDMVETAREVEVVIIQDGSAHQGRWVRCRILSNSTLPQAVAVLPAIAGEHETLLRTRYKSYDIFVHETTLFNHAVGFSGKVAYSIERKFLRHVASSTSSSGCHRRKAGLMWQQAVDVDDLSEEEAVGGLALFW